MTEVDDLSTRIRACAEKHGVVAAVDKAAKQIRRRIVDQDLYLEMCGLSRGSLANSATDTKPQEQPGAARR